MEEIKSKKENNLNSKKQMLLLIIGICVLISLVVGLTYAFFSFIYNSEDENSMRTGTIFFSASDTYMELSNVFPTTLEKTDKEVTISVQGYTTYEKGVDFIIKAVEVKSQNSDILPTIVVTRENISGITYTDGMEEVVTYDKNNRLTADAILCAGNIEQGDGIVDLTKILTIKVYYDMEDYHISDNTKEQLVVSGLLDESYSGEIIDTQTWNSLSEDSDGNKLIAYSFKVQVIAVDGENEVSSGSQGVPIVTINSGTVSKTKININYTVSDSDANVICEYGTTTSYGSIGTISGNTCVISGLSAGTTYYYRLVATNSLGEKGYTGGKTTTYTCEGIAGEYCYSYCSVNEISSCRSSYDDDAETACNAATSGDMVSECKEDYLNTKCGNASSCMSNCISEQIASCPDSEKELVIDKTAPVVTIKESSITKTGDTITIPYTVDDSGATVSCVYGTDTSYGSSGTISSGNCVISGLDYDTEYFYKIIATDIAYNIGDATGSSKSLNYCDHTLISVTSTCNSADYSSACSSSNYLSSCQSSCNSNASSYNSSCLYKCTGSTTGSCGSSTCGDCISSCQAEKYSECNNTCISNNINSCLESKKKSCITSTMNTKGCSGY